MFCSNCGSSVAEGTAFCPVCGARVARGVAGPAQPPAAAPVAYVPVTPAFNYATWGTRAVGYIIDALLVSAGMALLYVALGTVLTGLAGLGGRYPGGGMCCMFIVLFPLATLLVGLYNSVYLIAQRGYSIGQGVVHVKTVDGNGNLLSRGTAFLRLIVRAAFGFFPFLPALDLLWPLWDERRQTLHDKAVNSYVISNP